MPVGLKSAVESTFNVPPARLWPAAPTLVVVADVTVALSAGVPVHPVMLRNDVSVLFAYLQVPLPPVTLKVPVGPKSAVFLTVSVPPARSWLSLSTVVVAVTLFVSWKKSSFSGCSGNSSPTSIRVHEEPSKRWIRSSPLTRIPASTSSPFELIVALPVRASLTMSTLFTETATPIPTVPASVALPSALAAASVFASVLRATLPVALTVEPFPSHASERVSTMLIAKAPATVTVLPPWPFESDVVALALSVLDVLADLPVPLVRDAFAFETWSFAFLLVSLPEVSSSLFLAPVALANASVVFDDDPLALSATSPPPALSERVLVAETSSWTIARARARPMTTVP